MKALCWQGVGQLAVETVPDPALLNKQDVIVRVLASSVCGSDLHLLNGFVPAMKQGDVIGHEFLGEVVEVGSEVERHRVGDRVVVASPLGCGACVHCTEGRWSLCDNSNPTPELAEAVFGHAGAGIFGYSHAFGGFPGSHAEYIRVPFADHGAFAVPEGLSDEQALFLSDAVPTGWMAAEQADAGPGRTVAVWGAGGVGQMAARAAQLLHAEEVVIIDRVAGRLEAAVRNVPGVVPIDATSEDVHERLAELNAGRGPDACVEAVGMESDSGVPQRTYDRVKQRMVPGTDRAGALRQAIRACAKGGTVSVAGVFGGFVDKFPMGAVMNKALTLRSGQQHGQRYIPMLIDRVTRGELDPSVLATHRVGLEEGADAYEVFSRRADGCVRAVLYPGR
ncbi:MAG: glutathione-dependent formaldehyde dehydrogenase [Catenulispora sp.]|nr:glutathione-dependent formaldehyde dehydrogenase [Catenulispora sp.]